MNKILILSNMISLIVIFYSLIHYIQYNNLTLKIEPPFDYIIVLFSKTLPVCHIFCSILLIINSLHKKIRILIKKSFVILAPWIYLFTFMAILQHMYKDF